LTVWRRAQLYVLITLLAIAVAVFMRSRTDEGGVTGVLASNAQFAPLDVQEPNLRLDLLEKIHNTEYKGSHRDIFNAAPLPPPTPVGISDSGPHKDVSGPRQPPPPPPLQVPAQFFGYASRSNGKRVAFFLNGEDVILVAEGDTFMGNFRLVRIGNDSADVEEISSGRHAEVPLERLPDEGQNP
jgi:hypothetical protein